MRFSRWPWKPRLEDEVDEELAFHIEMRTRELVERGMAAAAARQEAERRFGNLTRVRKTCRDFGKGRDRHMRRATYVSELRQDLAFAARQMTKNPGFAAVAILTLALGIGATTAIFSAVYAVVLQPLPLRDPSRLLVVGERMASMPGMLSDVSVGNFVDARAGTTSFDGLAAVQYANFNLTDGVTPERVIGARVSAAFFDVMGSRPAIGRAFHETEDRPGADGVVVLSHRLWAGQFGARASAIGERVRMSGVPYTIVGVMPASFDLTRDSEDLWVPIAFTPAQKVEHDNHYLTVFGRLKAGATPEQAQAELDAVAARLRKTDPKNDGTLSFAMTPFTQQFVGDYRTRLLVLLAAVGLVLLIACANVANLLLARGAARGREIAVRTALGAGQWRIVRQLLTESLALGAASAALGVLLARWDIALVVRLGPSDVPRLEQAGLNATVLGFAVMIGLASSALFGLAPALQASRTDVQGGLRDGGRGATRGGVRDRLRAALVVAEVALSLLLLFGAGLLIRSAIALDRVNTGIDPHGVFTARFTLPEASYAEPSKVVEALTRIAAETTALHGVTAAAVSSYAAMGPGGGQNGLLPEGVPFALENLILSRLRVTTPGFFAAMRIPIVKGRAFDDRDRAGGLKVMVVSQALAARAFPGQDPIGKRIGCCEPGPDGGQDYKTIVGVAGDVRSMGPATPPGPEFYLPVAQAPKDAWSWYRTFYIVARADGDPAALGQPSRAALARVDPDLALFDARPMEDRLAGTLATSRFNARLLAMLGVVGLLLAASGIYGVIGYFVSQRTQEIGVRLALGATPASVVRLVVGQAMGPLAVGTFVGVAASLAASRAISSQLFDVSRTDPVTLGLVVGALLLVGVAASAVPARRAAALDPTRALQAE